MSKKLAILGIFVAVGLTVGGIAFAVVPGADNVIHGCAQRFTGLLRVVDDPSGCRRFETSLDWNVQGPQGEQGIQGEQGPPGLGVANREQRLSDSSIAHANSVRTAVATCPEGSIVLSGGWEELDGVNDLDVVASRPDLPAEVWVVTMANHTDQDQTFRAVALCAVTS